MSQVLGPVVSWMASPVGVVVLLVAAQRLAELVLAQRNTRRLLAEGGREVGRGHYPLFVLLHAAWLVVIAVRAPQDRWPEWGWLALFVLLQAGRVWVIATLGRYWTTRIITLEGAPLVRRGPFRWVRHPNYVVVAGEVAVLPLAFGLWGVALVFSIFSAALTVWRIRVEDAALSARRPL